MRFVHHAKTAGCRVKDWDGDVFAIPKEEGTALMRYRGMLLASLY